MRFLVQFCILLGSIWAASHYGFAVGSAFTSNPYLALLGYPAIALGPVIISGWIFDLFRHYPGIRTTAVYRYFAGHLASHLSAVSAVAVFLLGAYGALVVNEALIPRELWMQSAFLRIFELASAFATGAGLALLIFGTAKEPLTGFAQRTQTLRAFLRSARFALGGSARFGSMLDEALLRYEPGQIFIGRSLYGDRPELGINDDRHMLTLGGSRSGKGRSVIVPNLLRWHGSAMVIDPKGTIAAVTANRRGKGGGRVTEGFGQAVHIVDPFGIVPGHTTSRFNPLSNLDPQADDFADRVHIVVDALVIRGSGDPHWDESAATVIAGFIAWIVEIRGPEGTLKDALNLISLGDRDQFDALLKAMARSDLGGGLPARAAGQLQAAGREERGSILSTAMRHLRWLDSKVMQNVLAQSDFELGDLKKKPGTVYLVLPPEYLATHSRFLRLFVNLTLNAFAMGGRSRVPLIMMLDEFHALGNMPVIETAMGQMASYNIKIWPFIQNLTQLQMLYTKNWETFFANAAAVQVFAVNDAATEEYLVRRLGRWSQHNYAQSGAQHRVTELRTAGELEQDVSRESKRQIIFRNGADPLLITRSNYDDMFDRNAYDPDPDHA